MRHDMWKVIIDLPRSGSRNRNRKSRLRIPGNTVNAILDDSIDDYDSGPKSVSMSPRSKYRGSSDYKSSGDRLNPFRRFFRSRVGQHWDSVHAEVSSTLDNRTLMRGSHVWFHVYHLVHTDCYLARNGKIYPKGRRHGFEVEGLFVHPATGILCYKQERSFHRYSEGKYRFMDKLARLGFTEFGYGENRRTTDAWQNFRILSDLEVLEKKNGNWFINHFARHQPYDVILRMYNSATKTIDPVYFKDSKGTSPIYKVSHRQLGRKDLKKFADIIAGNPF